MLQVPQHHQPQGLVISTSKLIVLSDGRKVQVEEYGDPAGAPALWFHGAFSSRLEAGFLHTASQELGLRILSLDRAGCGGSDPREHPTPQTNADDAAEVLDAYGIEQAAVGGLSNGGMFAMAFASAHPERTVRAVPLNPSAPTADRAARRTLSLSARLSYAYLSRNRHLLTDRLMNPKAPGRFMTWLNKRSNADADLLTDPVTAAAWTTNTAEVLRQPESGYLVNELVMCAGPWGFDHRAVSVPVTLVSGDKDGSLGHAKVWMTEVPNGRLVLTPGGHGNIMDPAVGRRVVELLTGRQ